MEEGQEGLGRSPADAGSGHSAEPEPVCAVSAAKAASVPNAKVIFLDIDGPMIPATMFLIDKMCSWERRFPATTVAVLRVLCENTGAKVVFNTTHNNPMSNVLDIDAALVAHGFPEEHLHQTDRRTRYPSIARDIAIKEWLARHPEVTHWVALDDVLCAEKPNMIHVDADAGLHLGHLNLAAEVLDGKPCLVLI